MTGELDGQQAIVTGAASGIGRAAVAPLARRGAQVLAVDLDPVLEQIVGNNGSGEVRARRTDLADPAELRRLTAEVETQQRVILADSAATYPRGGVLDASPVEWRRVLTVNVVAAAAPTGAVARGPRATNRAGVLASDRASFVTGATGSVGGGRRLSRGRTLCCTAQSRNQYEELR